MSNHAKLSASSAHRWLTCPASVKAEEGLRDRTTLAASEGTAAHELAELCLTTPCLAESWVGHHLPENNAWEVTQEMADYVQQYADYVKSVGGTQEYECRVDFSEWVPGGFGTSDAIAIDNDSKTLNVIDLKYGKGVKVFAEDNPQGALYALGALNEYGFIYEFDTVVIHIVQPRLDHIDTWELTTDKLLDLGDFYHSRANVALSDEAYYNPTEDACRFCKAKSTCPGLFRKTKETVIGDFDDLTQATNPDALTDDQLRHALENKRLIEGWLKAVEDHVKERLTNGETFQGFKLVEGRSVRKWLDEEEAAKRLEDLNGEAYERKLLSPAKAAKAVGKKGAKELEDIIVKPEGNPTLAPEDDKRPAINVTVDDFEGMG